MHKFTKYAGFESHNHLSALMTTTQTVTAIGDVYHIPFDIVNFSRGIHIVDNDKIKFDKEGIYNLETSIQYSTPNASVTTVSIWLRKNDVDVPNSCTDITLQGSGEQLLVTLTFLCNVVANDYVQICWSDAVDTRIITIAERTNPIRPLAPGVILGVMEI